MGARRRATVWTRAGIVVLAIIVVSTSLQRTHVVASRLPSSPVSSMVASTTARHASSQSSLSPATPSSASPDPLLLRAARGESVERPPVWMMRQAGRHMAAYRKLVSHHPTFRERSEDPRLSLEISLQPYEAYGVDGIILFSDILTPLPAMGVEFDIDEDGKIRVARPIRTREDLARLKRVDDWHDACPFVGEVLRGLHDRAAGTEATVIGFIGLPYTVATYLVEGRTGTATGFQEMRHMMDAVDEGRLLRAILTLLADNLADYACYQIRHGGAQVLQVFDSWAGHLTEEEYARWALPYQQRVVAAVKRRHPDTPIIIYVAPSSVHDEISTTTRLARLGRSGADVVSVDHTVDIAEARRMLPMNVGIQGNMDPSVLRDGPLESIKRETERILSCLGGKEGGHIMNLGHGIDPNTPEEHAAFFVKTVQEFTY